LRNPAAVGGLIAFIGFEYIYILYMFWHALTILLAVDFSSYSKI
jgi:hypothetical protein